MISLVIFDLDDTLISEYEYVKSGYNVVAEHIANKYCKIKNEVYDELLKLFKEDSKMVFNRYFDANNIIYNEQDIIELINLYRNHMPNINLYDDAKNVFEELQKMNIKIALLSDGYKITQSNKVKSLKLDEILDYVLFTDELGREFWKPHPRGFEIISEKLGIPFEEIIYVGDNPKKDFYISKIYPIRTVRIKREVMIYDDNEYFENIRENKEIFNLNELIEIIKKDEI